MMKIEMTKEDIKRGKKSSCDCPIALALNRALNPIGAYRIEVYPKHARITRPIARGEVMYADWDLDEEAINFIKDFDAGNSVDTIILSLSDTALGKLKENGFKIEKSLRIFKN